MSDDELRDKLARLLAFFDHPSTPWHDLDVLDLAIYLMRADALMPVVIEHSAQVWSTGFREGRNADHQSCWWPKNPWRDDQ